MITSSTARFLNRIGKISKTHFNVSIHAALQDYTSNNFFNKNLKAVVKYILNKSSIFKLNV